MAWIFRPLVAVLLASALSACGGGVYFSIGDGWDNRPPQVQLTVSSTTAQPGSTLRLSAAAADENGIDQVAFYRIDGSTAVLLGTDGQAPYVLDMTVPNDGRSTLRVFAWAVDNYGNSADSAVVTVTLVP